MLLSLFVYLWNRINPFRLALYESDCLIVGCDWWPFKVMMLSSSRILKASLNSFSFKSVSAFNPLTWLSFPFCWMKSNRFPYLSPWDCTLFLYSLYGIIKRIKTVTEKNCDDKTYLEVYDEFFDGVESLNWAFGDASGDDIHINLTSIWVSGGLLHSMFD